MKPDCIIIHCSASRGGDAKDIDAWHKARGWSGIGYHAVILNGRRHVGSLYNPLLDGKIEPGRPDNKQGAHCSARGMNTHSLGVCLIGIPGTDEYPTQKQIKALVHYLSQKCHNYDIPVNKIFQHSDFDRKKPLCASLDIAAIRKAVERRLVDLEEVR